MKKDCACYMDRFLALDRNERLPLGLTVHLLFCGKCRNFVRRFTLLERRCSKENLSRISCDSDDVAGIMRRLDSAYGQYGLKHERVPMRHWVIAGAALVICVALFEIFAAAVSSALFAVPLSLCFAFTIILYCAVFVGANMDFFIKKWKIQ
ncbi:hypothetical protein [Treponema sp.]|uniref:hypothetical protein n=1 Tax=Treponema sp. TaxID=166 RepID=UPI003F03D502